MQTSLCNEGSQREEEKPHTGLEGAPVRVAHVLLVCYTRSGAPIKMLIMG